MRLTTIRNERGLSLRDLAEMIGKDASTVQRAEKMAASAKLETYQACADALGVPLYELFIESEEAALLLRSFDQASPEGRAMLLRMVDAAKALPEQPA